VEAAGAKTQLPGRQVDFAAEVPAERKSLLSVCAQQGVAVFPEASSANHTRKYRFLTIRFSFRAAFAGGLG